MAHPVLSSLKTRFFYITIWVLIAVAHIVLLNFYNTSGILISIADSLVFNLIFALIALSVWYIISNKPDKPGIINMLINQITSAIVALMIWLGASILLLHLIFPGDKTYYEFLISSLPWRIVSGIFFYSTTVLAYYISIYYENVQERAKTELQLRGLIKQAELDLLKSQINPHFLFNSLNSISSLTMTDAVKAQEMIIKLSEYLRYSISQPVSQLTSLGAELENINRYLEIEQVRFGEKLIYKNEIDPYSNDMKIPAMILQPLYENAIKHGVYESTEPICIRTVAAPEGEALKITITNNFDPDAYIRKGAGLGLKNIRERLKLLYRNELLLKIMKTADTFEVILIIPQSEV